MGDIERVWVVVGGFLEIEWYISIGMVDFILRVCGILSGCEILSGYW